MITLVFLSASGDFIILCLLFVLLVHVIVKAREVRSQATVSSFDGDLAILLASTFGVWAHDFCEARCDVNY